MRAWLFRQGVPLGEIGELDRWFVADVVNHPRDERGDVDLRQGQLPRSQVEADPLAAAREALRGRGLPEWRVDGELRRQWGG